MTKVYAYGPTGVRYLAYSDEPEPEPEPEVKEMPEPETEQADEAPKAKTRKKAVKAEE